MNRLNISIAVIVGIIKCFTTWQIEEEGKRTEFSKRNRGITATTFFKAFTIGIWELHEITLDTLAGKCCEIQYGLKLTKQSLSERLNKGSILLKSVFGLVMDYAAKNTYTQETIAVLQQFKNVYICDSTSISLPDKLAQLFKGLGGSNSKAAVKIQAMYNLLQKRFKSLEIWQATGNDSKYTGNIVQKLCKMDLVIFDLGYFSARAFKEIISKGAYFLSRVKTNTKFYVDSIKRRGRYTKVNIVEILKNSEGFVDQWIYIGGNKNTRTKIRLVAIRLPENIVNERRRKAHKKAKPSGKMPTEAETELLAWNIIITDVPETMLSVETICELYRIRWQVELIFKSWKSQFEIDEMNNVGKDYLECILYGKLIVITLITALYAYISDEVFRRKQRTVSMQRFIKNLREKADILLERMNSTFKSVRELLLMLDGIVKRSIEENRKRKTTERALMDHFLPEVALQIMD